MNEQEEPAVALHQVQNRVRRHSESGIAGDRTDVGIHTRAFDDRRNSRHIGVIGVRDEDQDLKIRVILGRQRGQTFPEVG